MLQDQVKVSFNFNPEKYLVYLEVFNTTYYLSTHNLSIVYWTEDWRLAKNFRTKFQAEIRAGLVCDPKRFTHKFD